LVCDFWHDFGIFDNPNLSRSLKSPCRLLYIDDSVLVEYGRILRKVQTQERNRERKRGYNEKRSQSNEGIMRHL